MDPALRIARVPRRPERSDLLVAGVLLVWALLEAFLAQGPGPRAARVLFALVITLPLAFRRQAPLATILILLSASFLRGITSDESEYGAMPFPAVLVATFSVALYARATAGAIAGGIAAVTWEVTSLSSDFYTGEQAATDYAILTFFVLGSWTAGWLVRRRAAQARRALDESGELARSAVVVERARIARELHDVVAHSVSVIAVQAGAAEELIDRDRQQAKEHIQALRRSAREALTEMRRLTGVLREEGAAYAPQPGLARLDELLEEARSGGLEVELVRRGEPVELPPGLDLTAYRIIQESLTNARKHAGPVSAQVLVSYGPRDLELSVVNSPGAAANGADSGGQGLVGMRERARLYAGTVAAEPEPGGGFRVHARLPLQEPTR